MVIRCVSRATRDCANIGLARRRRHMHNHRAYRWPLFCNRGPDDFRLLSTLGSGETGQKLKLLPSASRNVS